MTQPCCSSPVSLVQLLVSECLEWKRNSDDGFVNNQVVFAFILEKMVASERNSWGGLVGYSTMRSAAGTGWYVRLCHSAKFFHGKQNYWDSSALVLMKGACLNLFEVRCDFDRKAGKIDPIHDYTPYGRS